MSWRRYALPLAIVVAGLTLADATRHHHGYQFLLVGDALVVRGDTYDGTTTTCVTEQLESGGYGVRCEAP